MLLALFLLTIYFFPFINFLLQNLLVYALLLPLPLSPLISTSYIFFPFSFLFIRSSKFLQTITPLPPTFSFLTSAFLSLSSKLLHPLTLLSVIPYVLPCLFSFSFTSSSASPILLVLIPLYTSFVRSVSKANL